MTLLRQQDNQPSNKLVPRSVLWTFILITSCFAWWGLANNMTDTLLAAFKRIMSLSDFKTAWIQIAFYGSYFCLALPAAVIIKKWTYKTGILLGLGLFILGALLFFPASKTMNYGFFLLSLYILAGGLSVLETAANPYIIALGPANTGTQRLNFAQSFNPIGSVLGVFLSKWFILSHLNVASADERSSMSLEQLKEIQSKELEAVMEPYVAVALLMVIIWILIAITKMPRCSDTSSGGWKDLNLTLRRLSKNSHYRWGVIAQFFYVGAQIGVWSFTIRYVMQELNLNEADASNYYLAALILFMIFRFISTWLMDFLHPENLLVLLAILGMGCTLIVIFGEGQTGVYALIAISGCMSLMFPTIFGLAVQGLGEDTKIGGAGLIMAILGGAVLTPIQGQVSDMTSSVSFSYVIPLCCFLVIAYFGFNICRKSQLRERKLNA